jgi:beta-galactosidase/beta-glucuronidase
MKNLNSRDLRNVSVFPLRLIYIILCGIILFPLSMCTKKSHEYTRGIGIYPGDPNEDFSPELVKDSKTYRNLALHRPAFHSSSYDYNLTAQLVTDGIIETRFPNWFSAATSQHGTLKKNEREWIIDHNSMTNIEINSTGGWIQVEIGGFENIPEIDRIEVAGMVTVDYGKANGWEYKVSGSDDGQSWIELKSASGRDCIGEEFRWFWSMPGWETHRIINLAIDLKTPAHNAFYKIEFKAPNAQLWNIGGMDFYNKNHPVEIAPSYNFVSSWRSAGTGKEWIYVDLGANCSFDQINLHWIRRAASGSIQISEDAATWNDILDLQENEELTDEISFGNSLKGRYVRVLMTKPVSTEGYLLSELEVFGYGGPLARPRPSPGVKDDVRMDLAGGAWKIQRESLVNADGKTLSEPGFQDDNWLIATVPGTVLVSYLNVGAIPDPNFGDNQLMISESFFYSDFWYRNEFLMPSTFKGQHMFMNFDGINWKAEAFFNGHYLGRIEGAFTRGQFDVSDFIIPGQANALAVRIIKNDNPGNIKEKTALSTDKNGGALGADNPTYHASVGWDWIPTIRGRNIGIWNDVYLTTSGPVTIENPFIRTTLPLHDTTQADIIIEVTLRNHEPESVTGTLTGTFGDITFKQPVTLEGSESKTLKLDPATHPELRMQNPKLWWPAGYGKQDLYDVTMKFELQDQLVSDKKEFRSGVRQMTYNEEGGILKIWVNGRRFIGRGGNWGFPESNLCYRAREYDIAVRYHSDMNFTMIRNWVGQTGDEEFYEACDRHGVMVWQDFWLANPADGPDPEDNTMFLQNARDYILKIRNHPSIGIYVGRNEGYPPREIDSTIRVMLPELHPGLHYISNSAWDVVSGGGFYRAMPVRTYFKERATPKFHSEMGMPNIVTYESLQLMMPDSAIWPMKRMWGMHDFTLESAQYGNSFIQMIEEGFGKTDNIKDWVNFAQFINYQGYRAMFEAQSKNRMGLLLWMSHSAWPSLVWQTYDWYFEPTAAYFGCKKANEPIHIQWNMLTDTIEVVNYSAGDLAGLTAEVRILNLDGSVKWEKTVTIDSPEDSMVPCFEMEYPEGLDSTHFLTMKLLKDNEKLSENFYWRGLQEYNYKALRTLPKVKLETTTQVKREGEKWYLTASLTNTSRNPAIMVRLKVIREKSGDRILPVIYSDNYVSLMPGEQRTILIELEDADTRGEKPAVVVEGFNIQE